MQSVLAQERARAQAQYQQLVGHIRKLYQQLNARVQENGNGRGLGQGQAGRGQNNGQGRGNGQGQGRGDGRQQDREQEQNEAGRDDENEDGVEEQSVNVDLGGTGLAI